MSTKRRDPLPRLSIVQNLNMQQPTGGPGQALYSPALPTSIQQSFHPAFPVSNPLQTPMQSFFNATPGAPARPGHHAHHASIQLAAAGIHPPNYMTPVASHFPRPSIALAPGVQPQASPHPFPNRSRRQLSIGGPPKAVLGGPARKVSPLPGALGPSITPGATPAPVKTKKVIVNFPKETPVGEDGEPTTRPSWARTPLPKESDSSEQVPVKAVEIATAESYPPDEWRHDLPDAVDVYLPGKRAWDALKIQTIEEKLEKLGVERGSGSTVPQIHAPHARAASISSPADPALLLFKLNKLQQSQQTSSAGNSLSVSPQPPFAAPFGLSPSPRGTSRFLTGRHGHTMSLAQPPSYQSSLFSSPPSQYHNPLSSQGVLGSDSAAESSDSPIDGIYAPQGRVPLAAPSFAPPPLSAVGGGSHIDFIRGFGLDAPQESEEEAEEMQAEERNEESEKEELDAKLNDNLEVENNSDGELEEYDDGMTTVPQSRLHSRHVSRLSAALSLRSVGGNFIGQFQNGEENEQRENNEDDADDEDDNEAEKENEPPQQRELQQLDVDPVEEWTGSEDQYLGVETSDDESIGEWSNPSDEERARQQRNERRMRRRAAQQQQIDQPRRIPNFPRPPETTLGFISQREDDIISNPSEENYAMGRQAEFVGVTTELYQPEHPNALASSLALPHSRVTSGQYSMHDPAMAHSRSASGASGFPEPSFHHQSNLSAGRRESLNPLAKPFVFGARGDSGSWQPFSGNSTPPTQMPTASTTHTRLPSIGKPLNVAAVEFKPGAFNFRLANAPQMPVPERSIPLPLPQPAQPLETITSVESTPFKVQGREKRQRRDGSSSSIIDEGDSFASFKFPMKIETSSPQALRRRRSGSSLSGQAPHESDPASQPFTFAGFSAVANNMPRMTGEVAENDAEEAAASEQNEDEENANESGTALANDSHEQEIVIPALPKQKRAPIPLDFKHPVSGNTVPAGLFKALVNNDDRTRKSVRSRMSSRDIFEHMHRPSMDDDDVALIALKGPRSRLVTDPGDRPSPPSDDVFGSVRHTRRRSSLPDALHDTKVSTSPSVMSGVAQDLSMRMELHHIEDILSHLLDHKFADLRHHLTRKLLTASETNSAATETKVNEVISIFRAQLQESAARTLENSQMDARGELDFQMIKEVLEESQQQLLEALQREVRRDPQHAASFTGNVPQDLLSAIEQLGGRTINAVVEAISELSARQEAVALNASAREHDLIVDKLVSVLSPMLHSLQNDPIDYDFLTNQLAQAVKPHISQLIDLASDKRETAGLIVDKILPHIPSASDMTVDTDAITMKLIAEVRRAIAPIDAFEIKEQVADLVVERLDSRLAVRDKTFNVDSVTARVTESVSQLLESLNTVPSVVEKLAAGQKVVEEKQASFATSQSEIIASLAELPERVGTQLQDLKALQQDIFKKVDQPPAPVVQTDENVLVVKSLVEGLTQDQKKLAEQTEAAASQNKVLLDKLDTLPQEFKGAVETLQSALSDLITSQDSTKRELEDVRKLNAEYQVQVTKARSSYGQARVEKDVLGEKLTIVESERDRLRAKVQELEDTAASKTKETSTLQARNAELEEALAKALARLQSADVVAETNQRNIAELEKANKELSTENQNISSKADSLELGIEFAKKETENVTKALESLQRQHTQLLSQQNNWDALSAATEKINMVFNLLENADSEEQKELRHYRDQSKVLEDENMALQKRFKDLETKLANNDRTLTATRQSLTQAQQRSSEWERRAKECEGELEMVRTKFEQSEQTQSQLEADYQLVKMQLEEQEAEGRLRVDRENKLRDQVSALESKCVLLQGELEKARTAARSAPAAPFRPQTNGNTHPPPRPDSRASTIYDGRGETASRRVVSYAGGRSSLASSQNGPSEPSVWDSMHAPTNTNNQTKWSTPPMHTPSSRFASLAPSTPKAFPSRFSSQYARAPSPTPSTVSAAPTQGDDGWWT
ncbi:hypothetical protein JR316_0001233 [Psilocybe cubensis]|uniref:Uncharacterized protein n=2 Tax=Psilocybe cubensis TaxID=181762 RepID=A0A8H7YBH8_PSICU|nr:hypothetical protein JR316_0001233 [Psilocybe cubensis]KAH9487164.1 hypothetical protein JR316_0001233 [Psilocybe cubensis]